MKTLFIFLLAIVLLNHSCSNLGNNEKKAQYSLHKLDSLQKKYKSMYSSDDCNVCLDCSMLAAAIKYNLTDQVATYEDALIEYYRNHDEIPCPEIFEILDAEKISELKQLEEKNADGMVRN